MTIVVIRTEKKEIERPETKKKKEKERKKERKREESSSNKNACPIRLDFLSGQCRRRHNG